MLKIDLLEIKMLLWGILANTAVGWAALVPLLISMGYATLLLYKVFKDDKQEQPKEKCIMPVGGPL